MWKIMANTHSLRMNKQGSETRRPRFKSHSLCDPVISLPTPQFPHPNGWSVATPISSGAVGTGEILNGSSVSCPNKGSLSTGRWDSDHCHLQAQGLTSPSPSTGVGGGEATGPGGKLGVVHRRGDE